MSGRWARRARIALSLALLMVAAPTRAATEAAMLDRPADGVRLTLSGDEWIVTAADGSKRSGDDDHADASLRRSFGIVLPPIAHPEDPRS